MKESKNSTKYIDTPRINCDAMWRVVESDTPVFRRSRGHRGQAALLMGIALLAPPVSRADTDERQIRILPTSHPWYTCVKVRIGSEGNGRGSGILVAKCTILTNGHVVYNRTSDNFRTIYTVNPGSYYDETSGKSVDPFGSRPDVALATNTKWVNTRNEKYDYGAIFIGDSFKDHGISTYIPVSFDKKSSYVNLSGYPSEDLPSSATGATKEQWWGHGDVKSHTTRKVKYEATSTGGASGGGVWEYYSSTGERRLVAINRGHHNSDNDGTGVRLVSQNEDLIRDWMTRDYCSPADAVTATITFASLLETRIDLKGRPINILSPQALQIVPAEQIPNPPAPACKIMQWIEGTFYEWEEYHIAGGDVPGIEDAQPGSVESHPPMRFIRLLAPERRVLNPEEASVLLSASLLWQKVAPPRAPVFYEESDNILPVLSPQDTLVESDEIERGIYYKGKPVPVRILARTDTFLRLGWKAIPGASYRLVSSMDLKSWEPVGGKAYLTFQTELAELQIPMDARKSKCFFLIERLD